MSIYIFLGPSLSQEHAVKLLEATYLPPIQQGDLIRLLERKPQYVGIVDGYFETVPAVWHKEILFAMEQGVHVFGAASMGALRAAEMHSLGMVGIGTIFQWYRDGKIVADDEVAVRHGPAELGYLPLNNPLVDIRDSCDEALCEKIIDEDASRQIVAAAKRLPFWERTNEAVVDEVRRTVPASCDAACGWLDFVTSRYRSLKQRDAIALLKELQQITETAWQPKQLSFRVEPTIFVERLSNEVRLEAIQDRSGQRALTENHRMMEHLRRLVLLRALAREFATQYGWILHEIEITEQANALWDELGLSGSDAVQEWMNRNAISEQMIMSHLEDELYVSRLMRKYELEVERGLSAQIQLATVFAGEVAASTIHSPDADDPE